MGKIITFYSYKGGVGRSMALANVCVVLANRGYKTLIIDWDLEAPGIENFFSDFIDRTTGQENGLLDFLISGKENSWQDYLLYFSIPNVRESISILPSGKMGKEYYGNLKNFDVPTFYKKNKGGSKIEKFRKEIIDKYDFILIDSRTGITDFGGICTIQMPDIVVLLTTPSKQGLKGIKTIGEAIWSARDKLPISIDRERIFLFPIPTRVEPSAEFDLTKQWMDKFSIEMEDFYEDWLPTKINTRDFIEQIKIPYISRFSYEESLPFLDQGTSDKGGLGYAYENIATILASHLENIDAFINEREEFQRGLVVPLKFQDIPSDRHTIKKAFISSTIRDLQLHRKQVEEACLRMGVSTGKMVEDLTVEDANGVEVSLRQVNEADVYIGIFAYRYGFIPNYDNPSGISITEIEYNCAVERSIPRLIFFMHDDHPVKPSDVETGPGAEKLNALKSRIGNDRVVGFFTSPEDLRAQVLQAISQLKEKQKSATSETSHQFHYVHPMTEPPEPYIAHPYVLSQATGLIGRQAELNLLTDWITGKGQLAGVRIFNVIAIGGMGKSALTWEWFSNISGLEWREMTGRFWWSFYESDAHFENFIIRALAYVSRTTPDEVRKMPVPERETQLIQTLDREPYLFVLDGLERMLSAYAGKDTAHLADDDYDQRTANFIAETHGLSAAEKETFLDGHRLRKTADSRAGRFLKKLVQVRASKILVSSRLYPFDLQMLTGDPLPGSSAIFLKGLSDDDALALWRHFGCSGGRDELLRLFRSFGNHPLLLQILAGEVARYRPARGDFGRWHEANPNFNPFEMKLTQAKTHILEFALQGLTEIEMRVLQTIAAFRMPTQYETLVAVCVGENKPCPNSMVLDRTLSELEDRGLLGWEKKSGRYYLHPVVSGVVWVLASSEVQKQAYSSLQSYFEAAPKIKKWQDVNSIEELTSTIELYHALIGLQHFDDAFTVFKDRIDNATLYRLGANHQRIELLEKLFPDGLENHPRLSNMGNRAFTYNALGLGYQYSGEVRKGSFFLERNIDISEKSRDFKSLSTGLINLSAGFRHSGRLQDANSAIRRAWKISQRGNNRLQEAIILSELGLITTLTKQTDEGGRFLRQSLNIFTEENEQQWESVTNAYLAQHSLLFATPSDAKIFADRAWELARVRQYEHDFIRAACRQGQAALALRIAITSFIEAKALEDSADERLHHALTRARAINLVEEELPALITLAELSRQQNQPTQAREYLEDVWEPAERGPYPLLHADAQNVLCQIERDANNLPAAIAAAEQAYRLAWCDGPPWAYHYGLGKAKKHLQELGVAEPEMGEQ